MQGTKDKLPGRTWAGNERTWATAALAHLAVAGTHSPGENAGMHCALVASLPRASPGQGDTGLLFWVALPVAQVASNRGRRLPWDFAPAPPEATHEGHWVV